MVEGGTLIPVDDNAVSLYLNMFAPDLSDHNTLAVIGFVQVLGSILPTSEMQSRLFYDAMVGGTKLPSKEAMKAAIDKKLDAQRKRYVPSPRHTIQVDFAAYMDELGSLLRCKPNIFKLMFTDPMLAWALWTNPPISCTYRLFGPHPWEGARKALMESRNRIYAGMSPTGENLVVTKPKHVNIVKILTTTIVLTILVGIYTKKISYHNFINRFPNIIGN